MTRRISIGFDVGSSSVKAVLLDVDSGEQISSGFSPKVEMKIDSPVPGWAEQDPEDWWKHAKLALAEARSMFKDQRAEYVSIGISYQMHGLVIVDKIGSVLHPSIIWCDSRAVEIGNEAFNQLGGEYCLKKYLNSPGNFTASKLKWVKENKPKVYEKIYKIMLPGDYLGFKLTGELGTTISGLSEGILWDFTKVEIAKKLIAHYGLRQDMIPQIFPTFGEQGLLCSAAAEELGPEPGIPVTYRAGDQPNNAFSLNVLNPGEIASTAGTSGVVYGITGENLYDEYSRVNSFAHVNYTADNPMLGVLLCINGTGIMNSWVRKVVGENLSYQDLNLLARQANVGSNGLKILPFGNGAERMLRNIDIGCMISGINFNLHGKPDIVRAAQEGIAFAFKYGVDIVKKMGMDLRVMRAGNANMFQSRIFTEALANTCESIIEIYNTDGAQGAARGAAYGAGIYSSFGEAFAGLKVVARIEPQNEHAAEYDSAYNEWLTFLESVI